VRPEIGGVPFPVDRAIRLERRTLYAGAANPVGFGRTGSVETDRACLGRRDATSRCRYQIRWTRKGGVHVDLKGKKVIAIGEQDGVQADSDRGGGAQRRRRSAARAESVLCLNVRRRHGPG